MPMRKISYDDARKLVRVGDVVAFGGATLLSKVIKAAGKTVVSHAGAICAPLDGAQEPRFVESTVRLDGEHPTWRVQVTPFAERWKEYEGEVWVLPLAAQTRSERFDEAKFLDFVKSAEGKLFDIPEGVAIIIKELLWGLDGEDLQQEEYYFCSELVAAAFLAAGTISEVEPSDVSPKDLCRWRMYEDVYFLREGPGGPREIAGYNSLPPGTT